MSLRKALRLAQPAGIGPTEVAEHTGYARSTIAKTLRNMPHATSGNRAAGLVPAQAERG
ncbi:hypothetical protein [Streptomyces sp. NPDC051546]|uniref:hypothetical protein n=1 Tax=Streptomyces sp. NPDC051546 TaxID=3365655 RepID=UPI0037A3438B